MPFTSQAIADHHDLAGFDSGQPALDNWLSQHARTVESRRTGRTFVWLQENTVVAYYTIAAHVIMRESLPRALGRGNPAQIPAVLLARLALDKTCQGQRLGSVLLADALRRIVLATQTVAARFVVVDAVDQAAHGFYQHHGFRAIPDTRRLLQKVSDIAAAVGT